MQKHVNAFMNDKTLANARRLVAHVRKHPMVMCMLTEGQAAMVREAARLVDREG